MKKYYFPFVLGLMGMFFTLSAVAQSVPEGPYEVNPNGKSGIVVYWDGATLTADFDESDRLKGLRYTRRNGDGSDHFVWPTEAKSQFNFETSQLRVWQNFANVVRQEIEPLEYGLYVLTEKYRYDGTTLMIVKQEYEECATQRLSMVFMQQSAVNPTKILAIPVNCWKGSKLKRGAEYFIGKRADGSAFFNVTRTVEGKYMVGVEMLGSLMEDAKMRPVATSSQITNRAPSSPFFRPRESIIETNQ